MNQSAISHVDSLRLRLSNERARLALAKTDAERQLRSVWVSQLENEIAAETRFVGVAFDELSEDELLAELLSW